MVCAKHKNILCLATTQETAKNMVTKVRFMFDNLPSWLKIKEIENNRLSLNYLQIASIPKNYAFNKLFRISAID